MCGSHLCGWACGNCGAAELGEVFACTAEPARAAACERGVGCEFHSMCWLCLACTCSRETTAACLGCVGGREFRAVCLLLTSRNDRYFSFIRIFFFFSKTFHVPYIKATSPLYLLLPPLTVSQILLYNSWESRFTAINKLLLLCSQMSSQSKA